MLPVVSSLYPRVQHDGVEPGGGVGRDRQVAVYERKTRPADPESLRAGLVYERRRSRRLCPEGLTRVAVTFAPSAMVAPSGGAGREGLGEVDVLGGGHCRHDRERLTRSNRAGLRHHLRVDVGAQEAYPAHEREVTRDRPLSDEGASGRLERLSLSVAWKKLSADE